MAVQAYILIQTEVGSAEQVADEIAGIPGVVQSHDVTGPYDVIVRADAADMDELDKLVALGVRPIRGITRTVTCPVVRL
jgi:DNA-binding Lrp family transcriptional regulator